MRAARRGHNAVLITNAERSAEEDHHERVKIYTILMAFHLTGFTAAGILVVVSQLWWLALALAIVTGVLPWIAVVLANDPRPARNEKRAEKPPSQQVRQRHS